MARSEELDQAVSTEVDQFTQLSLAPKGQQYQITNAIVCRELFQTFISGTLPQWPNKTELAEV
jgi:hypothetical protein